MKPEKFGDMIGLIVLLVVIVMLFGTLPVWPYSSAWGYGPLSLTGVVLLIVILLLLFGRL